MELAERDRVPGRSGEAAPNLARMVGDDRFQSVFGFRCGYTTAPAPPAPRRSVRAEIEEHTSELQSHLNLVCRLLLEKKKQRTYSKTHCESTTLTATP